MAAKTNKIEVEIVATDEATPTINRLEQKIDGLEADEARVTVTANTDRLTKQLDAAKQKLEGLDGDEATVQARLVGNLETQLEQAQSLFRQLDGKTGTVRLTAVDRASGDLDKVQRKLHNLDGEAATVRASMGSIAGGVAGGIGLASLPGIIQDSAQNAINLELEVQQVADLTGSTLDSASRLAGVFRQNGVETSDLLDMILNVNQVLLQQPDLAAKLGVTIGDNTSLIDTFVQAVDGVSTAYDNAGERAVAASTLFGEEGVRQVQAVKTAIDEDLGDAIDEFSGPIVTDESVDNARKLNTELAESKAKIQEISLLLLPAVNEALVGLAAYFQGIAAAGNAVGNAGGAVRRYLFGGPGQGDLDYARERAVIGRNIGANEMNNVVPYGTGVQSAGVPWYSAARVTIVNPPGTPPATADQLRLYDERNGPR